MIMIWLLSLIRRDASVVDPFWGFGFCLVAWCTCAINWPCSSRMILMAILTTVWGLRLSLFLAWRNWGHEEDRRYAAIREKHGHRFWWVSLITVFLLQGFLIWFISFPIQWVGVNQSPSPIGWLDIVGVILFLVGLFFESVGDWQLARFKSKPENKGQVFNRGLWRFTRHPNYFGDFCVWWGIYLVSINGGAPLTIASPILMSFLLLKVSGVTLLEKSIEDRRPAYKNYRQQTNAFFPWFPKSG